MTTGFVASVTKPILKNIRLSGTRFSPWNLTVLDESYRKMNEHHRRVHAHMIDGLKGSEFSTVLEVACGTGWNIPRFREAGLSYFGLDISETAVALAAMKFPENRFFNVSISDCCMFQDGSFDVVYNSAMLEHIGCHEFAIGEMVRMAKHQVVILFYEGLSDGPENEIRFHTWDQAELSGEKTNVFGRKLLLQNHRVHDEKGWYWNRYSRSQIERFFSEQGWHYELLSSDNCPVIEEQTVAIIKKAASSAGR